MSASRRSIDEQILDIQEKQKILKEKERRLKAKLSAAERKKRTKHLIEIGASVEYVLGNSIEKEDLPKLIAFLESQELRGHFFSSAMAKSL